jgi:hypothetical protein
MDGACSTSGGEAEHVKVVCAKARGKEPTTKTKT